MSKINIQALRDEFTGLVTAEEALIETSSTAKRKFTAEETTASEGRYKRMDEIKSTLENTQKLAGANFTQAQASGGTGTTTQPANTNNGAVEGQSNPAGDASSDIIIIRDRYDDAPDHVKVKVKRADFRHAFNRWAANGNLPQKFATITTATQSGIFLPTEVDEPIVPSAPNTIREALAAWNQESMKTPGTEQINLPVADANSGGQVAENATTETENEPALTESINLTVKTYQSGSSWFSNQQLMAVNYDLMSALLPALAYSKELALESAVFAAMIADAGITQSVSIATDAGFTYGNLVSSNRVLPKRFNPMKVIILNKDSYTAAENLTTTTGYPILNALNPQNSQLKFFNGTPVLWTDYLQTLGTAGHVIGLVISLIGFRLRDAGQQQVQRYTQYPLRPAQTGFNLFGFHGWGYAPNACAKIVCP